MDERNPENSMPYYPTEQDWTQTIRPSRIPMDEQFPGKYMVNSLPLYGAKREEAGPWELRRKGKGKALLLWNTSKRRYRPASRAECLYPNTIPLDEDNKQAPGKPDAGATHDTQEQPGWLEDAEEQLSIEEHLARIHMDDSDYIHGTANQE